MSDSLKEKISYHPEEIVDVKVQDASKKVTYKTKLIFLDKERGKKEIVSVAIPMVTNWGGLQFTLEDRVIVYPLTVIFNWETEQLVSLEAAKIVI